MKISFTKQAVAALLMQGNFPVSDSVPIENIHEGVFPIVFQISSPNEPIKTLRLSGSEGARGAFNLKHLIPINDPEQRKHMDNRYRRVRELITHIGQSDRSGLVPIPLYFNEQEKTAQFRVMKNDMPKTEGMIATLWKTRPLKKFPLQQEGGNPWSPVGYRSSDVYQFGATLAEWQTQTERFLFSKSEKERAKIQEELRHEQRYLPEYDTLVNGFLSVFRSEAKERLIKNIESFFQQEGISSFEEGEERFRSEVDPEKTYRGSFRQLLFTSEWQKAGSEEILIFGKTLDRLRQAQALFEAPERSLEEIRVFTETFTNTYGRILRLPKGGLLQEANPYNIFINENDGKTAVLDVDEASYGIRIADLACDYIDKILTDYTSENISEEHALELIRSVISGYNANTTPLSKEELALLPHYATALFCNFLSQFEILLSNNPETLNVYNPAMSLETFSKGLKRLRNNGEAWESIFLPKLYDL